jgi:hypothetical protein
MRRPRRGFWIGDFGFWIEGSKDERIERLKDWGFWIENLM